MDDKFKKIDKEFLLTDSSVNSYGFRLLTSGYLMDEFKKNPVGYWMHGQEPDYPRSQGVLVKWEDLRQDDDKVYGKPVINLSHPRGQRTADEIENGFLNAASLGHFVVLEMEKNPANPLPNQTGPTVTKWFNREASLVDIPANFNALTGIELFDKNGREINLADFIHKNNPTMEKTNLSAEQLSKLGLKAEATQSEFNIAFDSLVAKAAEVDGLKTQLSAAVTAKTTAETALSDFKKDASKKEVDKIIADGLAAKKMTVDLGNILKSQYAEKPAELQSLVDKMQPIPSITSQIETADAKNQTELNNLMAKDYEALDKEGKLARLRALSEEGFQTKFKEKYGKEYGK